MGRADLVVLRATRDYAQRLDEFLVWTTNVTNLLNPPAVVAWNADRRYLDDLADRGVETMAGEVYAPGTRVGLPRTGHAFVSPTIGTGTRRFSDRSAVAAYVDELHQVGRSVLVQPGGSGGETALVFLGGKPSHAFSTPHDSPRQGEPDFEIWDAGAAALGAAAAQVGIDVTELLYARAHLIGTRLLELQLIEPSLGWRRLDPDTRFLAQRRFALCVESALERLGLGPRSRP